MMSLLVPYSYALFVVILYLIGNFFTVITLEYKLKNINLNHTFAAFVCIALSVIFAYIVPITIFGARTSIAMQIVGVSSAFFVQGVFWLFWFKGKFKNYFPSLVFAFLLSVLISLSLYNVFIWYVTNIFKETVRETVQETVRDISSFL